MPWLDLRRYGFRRRNTCLLKGLAEDAAVGRVIVVTSILRSQLWMWFRGGSKASRRAKTRDVFVCALLPERRWIPASAGINRLFARLQIGLQSGEWALSECVVWCYWPAAVDTARKFGLKGSLVFDVDHNILNDENRSAGDADYVLRQLRACAADAKLVVAASRSILHWFRQNGARRVALLRNAVDLSRFDAIDRAGKRRPPRIGYVGTLSSWIDFQLFRELVSLRPNWSFVVAGPLYRVTIPDALLRMPNIEFLGDVTPDRVPGLLRTFDAAVVLYRREPWLDLDSMKLYEYLAAGLPVVTTPFHERLDEDFDRLLAIASTAPGLARALDDAFAQSESARALWHARRVRFLTTNTWGCRAKEAVAMLKALEAS